MKRDYSKVINPFIGKAPARQSQKVRLRNFEKAQKGLKTMDNLDKVHSVLDLITVMRERKDRKLDENTNTIRSSLMLNAANQLEMKPINKVALEFG